MQPQSSSKTNSGKNDSKSGKSRLGGSAAQQSGRTKNTSGGDSGGGGKRMVVLCDGKDVTPKELHPVGNQKDVKPETLEETIGKEGVPIESAAGAEGRPAGAVDETVLPVALPPEKGKPAKAPGLSKDELDRNVDIILSETDTDTLLFFPSLCVALDNPNANVVNARNQAYTELVQSKADSDKYHEQHAQTLNQPPKNKEVLAAPPQQESVEVNANRWDIYDTFATDPVPKHEQIQQACERESQTTVSQAVKKPGCLFNMNDPHPRNDAVKDPSAKGAKQDGKTGGGKSASGAGRSGLAGGGSRPLGGTNTTGSLTSPASAVVGSTTGGGGAGEERDSAPGSMPRGPGSTTPAAADLAASALQEEKTLLVEDTYVDPIPWKVGATNPIPEEMTNGLRTMERIVSQNVFHKQHMIYRNYPTLEELAKRDEMRADESSGVADLASTALDGNGTADPRSGVGSAVSEAEGEAREDEGDGAAGEASRDDGNSDKTSLQDLFCFAAPQLTQGMTVTCMEWNSRNQDLLAVSYGDTAPVPNAAGGLVLFWSLKNPTYPERVIRTKNGVTALHFSGMHPNMVAAGTHDGSVMIWDLRRPSDIPVLKSGNDQKHKDIVWETRWVDRGPDKQPPELLVSVSSDGKVLQWSMKKGLEQTPLMQLKRLPNHLGSNSVYGHKEGIVFRKSSGFCVDFPRHDPATYLVGTEDGLVHRCSTSYNEQYLDTFYGHSGPVYRVRCNPFMSHAFLTCSADWTMRLWTTKPPPGHQQDAPLLTFQSTDLSDAVNDVIWAPQNSTSFAAAMDDGRVELWDLSEKPLDPIVTHYPRAHKTKLRRTCIRFSPNSPVLVAGDDQGSVDVMRMYNTNQSYYSVQEQQERLNAVIMKKK
eukprot:TRINITY_DN22760_c0_g2_i1.p1 TRINITY_DN22760_c0_g2~~TRINITY_DN22760_c0_g2_i1.p1  ORF type:complete len:875 (-),score=158.77 TRINITY_DN22760_c0_g2_i1:75-2699(-)